ncbi:MAG: hypothetical protein H9W82_12140 [Lactobacillus sp.]|nr:hypothetical protein [Lactobacillus sp.]
MKVKVTDKVFFVELRDTKNVDYKILILGASDFSGTLNFIVNTNDFDLNFDERDLVEIEYNFQIGNRKVGNDYLEVVNNRRLTAIRKA